LKQVREDFARRSEQPRWRGEGKELYFMAADAKMMAGAVKVAAGNVLICDDLAALDEESGALTEDLARIRLDNQQKNALGIISVKLRAWVSLLAWQRSGQY
jgi:hypothetical protein